MDVNSEDEQMKLTEVFLAQLDAEAARTVRALEVVPDRPEWKPHERSMPLSRLARLVATMPSWLSLIIDRDDLDLSGSNVEADPRHSSAELLKAHTKAVEDARHSLQAAHDDLLMKPWRLRLGDRVVSEDPKYVVMRDTFTHLAHHRGQLSTYLRPMGAKVPPIYGPTADTVQATA
jgi:uncharacterized damage-inducible protein DinB